MSRSRKKKPIYKWKDKHGKRAAAKAFRHYKEDVPSSAKQFFRRVYNSYNVIDNIWYYAEQSKERNRFKEIYNELERNADDRHLSEEEAYALLDELKQLKWCYTHVKK